MGLWGMAAAAAAAVPAPVTLWIATYKHGHRWFHASGRSAHREQCILPPGSWWEQELQRLAPDVDWKPDAGDWTRGVCVQGLVQVEVGSEWEWCVTRELNEQLQTQWLYYRRPKDLLTSSTHVVYNEGFPIGRARGHIVLLSSSFNKYMCIIFR